jgi:hypothetical protein
MKRILIPLVIAAGLLGPPAHATTAEAIVAELREQGYRQIEIRRTLLGRTRIIATSPNYNREIVLNPSTGVILRDLIRVRDAGGDDDGFESVVGRDASRDGGNGSSSSGSSRDDNDDDDDDGGSGSSGGSSGGGSGGSGDDNDDDNDDGDSGGGSSGDDSSGGDDSDDDDD